MLQQHFSSPEDAVLSSFPPGAVRVVASRTSGDDAYVLVDTRPDGPPYLYGVEVTRDREGWIEGGSGNSAGWRLREFGADVGTLVVWEEAPPGADRVRVEFEGDVHEEPIENGAYLSAWWRVPYPDTSWPRIVSFRIDGRWIDADALAPRRELQPTIASVLRATRALLAVLAAALRR
jgi:hypothetical protein